MSQAEASPSSVLAGLVDRLSTRLQAGEAVDWEAEERAHPEFAEELRRLRPALGALRDLSRSAAGKAPEGDPQTGMLGDFRIVREVGRGGMGVVYEAEQISLRRRVALKVLPFAGALDPRQLQRFQREAEAAAQLHHTHIVPVFFVGSERGVHFYAMQLIAGRTLADVVAGLRGPALVAGGGAPGAPTVAAATTQRSRPDKAHYRAVARWGVQAAEALEYAHSMGVVHRDIKPANLLLDARGEVWVTDFGLAQFRADAGLTMTGDLVGTLRYMSPEQALARHGLVDHRTDVYSLGVTLYELLALRPAFAAENREMLLRQVTTEDPPAPRRLNPAIPAELETIVLKAIAKEPEARYATAGELAEDLQRYLADQTIRARRPSVWQRGRKWAARHRAAVASAGVVLFLATITLVAGLLWHNERLRQAAEREQRQAGRAVRQRDAARRAVDDMYTQVAEKWLASEPGMSDLQRQFLEKALGFYEDLAREEEEGPELLLERAKANRRSAAILDGLERRTEAEAAYRRAIALLEGADVPGKAAELAESYALLGNFLFKLGRNAEMRSALQRAISLWESVPADEAARPEVRFGRARTFYYLGWSASGPAGPGADSAPSFRQGLPLARGLVAEFPREARYRTLLGTLLNGYGIATSGRGDPAQACQYLEEAVGHQQEAVKLDPKDPKHRLVLRNSYASLAAFPLLALKRYPDAVAAARKSLAVTERLVADFPSVPHYQRCLADAHGDLGSALRRAGRLPDAEEAYRQAVTIQERVLAADPTSPVDRWQAYLLYQDLAGLMEDAGRAREAVGAYRKAVQFNPKSAAANNNLARLLALGAEPGFNDYVELVRLARTAAELAPQEGGCWVILGLAHYRAGDWAAAKAALGKASNLSPVDDGWRGLVLAMAEWRLGNQSAARAAYERAVERLGQEKSTDGETRRLQAEAAELLGRSDRPKPNSKEAPPPKK